MRGSTIRSMSRRARLVPTLAVAGLLASSLLAPLAFAAAPNPAAGGATVDGDPTEWSTTTDFFTVMTTAGSAANDTLATLYLRYDCTSHVLYGLVLTEDGYGIRQTRPEEAYLRIDGAGKLVSGLSGNDGTPPDFAWVDGDGTLAGGFEASASLAPGTYTIRAHILIADDSEDGYTATDTVPHDGPLVIACAQATPTPTATPTASPTVTPTPTPTGSVAPTASSTVTPTPTVTPSGSVSPTAAPTATPTPPTGSVGGATGTPRVTLPPTDLAVMSAGGGSAAPGLAIVAGLLSVGLGVLLAWSPRRARGRVRRPR